MSIEKAKAYLRQFGAEDRVIEFPVSSATVELAAEAAHCEPARIAKTLSFRTNDGVILIIAAGDTKIDNPKYKARFGCKARMLAFEEVEPEIGHAVGGVCPFGVNGGVTVYLDESLRRFETVFPACGSSNSAIEVTIPELEIDYRTQNGAFQKVEDIMKISGIKEGVYNKIKENITV